MKFNEFKNIDDYNLKLVEVVNLDDKSKKGLKIDTLSDPLLGVLYIDHECGVSLRILGNYDKLYDDSMLIVRADSFNDIEFKIINDNKYDKYIQQIKDGYYTEELDAIREEKVFDEFRHSQFPDDIEAMLPLENQLEQLWVRLIMKTSEENLYVGELLNTSYTNKNYKAGSKVALSYYENDTGHCILIKGLVKMVD